MRLTLSVAALAAMAACSAPVPSSNAPNTGEGVGFGNYNQYLEQQRARDAALAGNAVPPAGTISDETTGPGAAPLDATNQANAPLTSSTLPRANNTGEELAAETRARLAETSANSGQDVVHASPSNPAPQTVATANGISEENDFNAVGNARSIDDDAQLIAQNRAQYQVVQPTALPTRSGNVGPNIVEYALSTKHPVGTQVHSRVGINKSAKFERNCAKYPSPDIAQADFLEKGGPSRDKLGLDPDGDGFACAWNPQPFRTAVGG